MKTRIPEDPILRFYRYVFPMGDCLLWTGSYSGLTASQRYGKFHVTEDGVKKRVRATRWIYQQLVRPLEDWEHLDHLCRNPPCVWVGHLDPVTCRENLARGDTWLARQLATTHCPQGHPYAGDNLVIDGGKRKCRICKNERVRAWHLAYAQKHGYWPGGARFTGVVRSRNPTHCPQGHPYEGDNLLIDAGKRKCRICKRARIRAWHHRFKEKHGSSYSTIATRGALNAK